MDELGLDVERLLRQRGWLRALARGLVSAGEVDDLVQESWLAALRARTGPRRSLRAWFAGLARNAARGMRRTRKGAEPEWEALADERPVAGELVARAELQERLIAAVRALREPYRTTVLLHYFEELTLAEVGRRTGVLASTARTRLARALAELRERLEREQGGSAWALVVALARGGAAPAAPAVAHTVSGVIVMGTLLKVGGAALAAGLVLLVWTQVEGANERRPAASEAPAANLAESNRPAASAARTPSPSPERAAVESAHETRGAAPRPAVEQAAPAPPEVAASPLERRLDAVADSFLTEDPDLAGLLYLSTALADGVIVVPESVEIAQTGSVSGKLEAGGNLKGGLVIHDQEYEVEVSSWNTAAPLPRSFRLELTEENGAVSRVELRVGSNPLKDPAHPIGGEEWIGWRLEVDPTQGAKLRRTTMRIEDPPALPGSPTPADYYLYEVHDTPDVEPRPLPWITSADFDPWLARLRPLRER